MLIHERELRFARERGVEIEFCECDAAMFQRAAGDLRQTNGERVGFLATVRFDIADDHVASSFQLTLRGLQHGVGLADAGRHAEKNLEPTAFPGGLRALDGTQQRIRIGAVVVSHGFRVCDEMVVS